MPYTKDMPFLREYVISDNLTETAEGYLICHNVPVAKIGVQDYYGFELGLTGNQHSKIFKIRRQPEDVFADEALMSLEGKAITDDHPAEGVDVSTHAMYSRGHVQNVRHNNDHILADLVITDPHTITKVKSGKRGVSCGYNCDYIPEDKPERQTNLRFNHVAIVDRGRAGPKVIIKDKLPTKVKRSHAMNKKEALTKMFAAFAKDASPEELLEILPFLEDKTPAKTQDADPEKGVMAKLIEALTGKITADAKPEDPMEKRMKSVEDGMAKILTLLTRDEDEEEEEKKEKKSEMEDEDPDEEESKKKEKTEDAFLKDLNKLLAKDEDEEEEEKKEKTDDEDPDEEKKEAKDAKDAAVMAMAKNLKPIIAKLPKAQRKVMTDALLKAAKDTRKSTGTYARIKKAAGSHAKDAATLAQDHMDLGKKWAEKYNLGHMKPKEASK